MNIRRLRHPSLSSPLSLLCFGGFIFATIASAQDAPIAIGKVQGTGERSPLTGQTVTVEGVVTTAFGSGLGGWFLQDAGDGDAATSDALFVAAAATPAAMVGQRVRVRGTVVEQNAGSGTRTGPAFTVAANHFKSKGCGNASGADADQKYGQSCWNATRTESARRLAAWLHTDPTRSSNDLAMIVGDLNAYSMEGPVQTLVAAGWRDASAGQRGPAPYSYVYDSLTGRLDHALLSPTLAVRVVGAAEWHSNADEPDSRGYQTRPGDRSPWRSSDHNPLVVGFRLRKP